MTLYRDMTKRLFDVVVAAAALVVVAPLLGLIALFTKLGSPGPVIYRGSRVGLHGKLFAMLKFRTMVVNAESLGGSATAADDPRITPIGKFLRRYKLDELPQLLNVLAGDMSFVGPRPEVKKYVDMYRLEEKAILTVRPGITDWASIWNSNEAAVLEGSRDPEKTYEELIRPTKLALQLFYVRNHSLTVDLKILFHTAFKLICEDWVPRELKPYGRVRRYRMASETSA
jgi:lipopolysaccharide/colanic/teichoic acid biosynthesis glycosyltransferase